MGSEKLELEIKEFVEKVGTFFDVEKVLLFGSRARGDFREKSDVDLIIISRDFEGKRSFERAVELYKIWWDRADRTEIDIICLTPAEFELMRKRIGVVAEAAREGIEI